MSKKRILHCEFCFKAFTRPSALRPHRYTHTGEKPFACHVPGCGRRFTVISNLRRHYKVHERRQFQPVFATYGELSAFLLAYLHQQQTTSYPPTSISGAPVPSPDYGMPSTNNMPSSTCRSSMSSMSSSTSSAPDSVESTPIPPDLQLRERHHYHQQLASPSGTLPLSEVSPGLEEKAGVRSIPFTAISSNSSTGSTATTATPLSLDATPMDAMSSPFLFDTTTANPVDKSVFDNDQLLYWTQPQQQKQLYPPYDNSIPQFYYT